MAADPDRSDEAVVGLAVFDARRKLLSGDWREPLLEIRDMIPESDAAIMLRDLGWVSFVSLVRQTWSVFAVVAAITIAGVVASMLVGRPSL